MALNLDYLKNCFKLFFLDEKSFDFINDKITWQRAFSILLLIDILFFIFFGGISLYNLTISKTNLLFIMFISLLLYLIIFFSSIFLVYSLHFILLKIVGGKGSFFETLKFSFSISIVLSFLSCFIYFLPYLNTNNILLTIIFLILNIIVSLWTLLVYLKVYSKIHKISKFKVFLAIFLIPLFIIIVFIIVFIIISFLLFYFYFDSYIHTLSNP
jgi:hypothetical protein